VRRTRALMSGPVCVARGDIEITVLYFHVKDLVHTRLPLHSNTKVMAPTTEVTMKQHSFNVINLKPHQATSYHTEQHQTSKSEPSSRVIVDNLCIPIIVQANIFPDYRNVNAKLCSLHSKHLGDPVKTLDKFKG
jgi:hypothetical protein